jgi:hypothetical protein
MHVLLGSQCCLSNGLVANGIRLIKRCNALSSWSDVTRGLPDLDKSFTLLVCVCFLTSRRRGWNLRTWHKIHWSDESRFLLHVTDGQMRVWRHKNTAYNPKNIHPTVPYGGGSVMVWGCISHRNRLSSDQWILRHVLKFQPRRAKHHAKHDRWCRSTNSGRLMTLLDLSPADFRRFLTVLCERLAKIRQTTGNIWSWRQGIAAFG